MKKYIFLIILQICFSLQAFAQATEVEMADTMRSNGKIYVVVVVLGIILMGMIAYVIAVDRKISRIEKELDS